MELWMMVLCWVVWRSCVPCRLGTVHLCSVTHHVGGAVLGERTVLGFQALALCQGCI